MSDTKDHSQREQAIAKAKKLMALSGSSNEHEAQVALNQALKLMQKFKLDETDLNDMKLMRVEFVMPRGFKSKTKIRSRLLYLISDFMPMIIFTNGACIIYAEDEELFKYANEICCRDLEARHKHIYPHFKASYKLMRDISLKLIHREERDAISFQVMLGEASFDDYIRHGRAFFRHFMSTIEYDLHENKDDFETFLRLHLLTACQVPFADFDHWKVRETIPYFIFFTLLDPNYRDLKIRPLPFADVQEDSKRRFNNFVDLAEEDYLISFYRGARSANDESMDDSERARLDELNDKLEELSQKDSRYQHTVARSRRTTTYTNNSAMQSGSQSNLHINKGVNTDTVIKGIAYKG